MQGVQCPVGICEPTRLGLNRKTDQCHHIPTSDLEENYIVIPPGIVPGDANCLCMRSRSAVSIMNPNPYPRLSNNKVSSTMLGS